MWFGGWYIIALNTFPGMTRFDIFLAPPGQYICVCDRRAGTSTSTGHTWSHAWRGQRLPLSTEKWWFYLVDIWLISGTKKKIGKWQPPPFSRSAAKDGLGKDVEALLWLPKKVSGKNRKATAQPERCRGADGKISECWHFRTNNQTICNSVPCSCQKWQLQSG